MNKKTKSAIIAACEKANLSEFWTGCMVELYDLQFKADKKHGNPAIIATVVSVSRSGMSRRVKFGLVRKNGEIQDITPAIAAIYGAKISRDDWSFSVSGCGMDMVFSVLYTVYRRISAPGYPDYNFFCRYKTF